MEFEEDLEFPPGALLYIVRDDDFPENVGAPCLVVGHAEDAECDYVVVSSRSLWGLWGAGRGTREMCAPGALMEVAAWQVSPNPPGDCRARPVV